MFYLINNNFDTLPYFLLMPHQSTAKNRCCKISTRSFSHTALPLILAPELGEATPSIEIAGKLAEALKVSLDYLVLGKSDPTVDHALLDKLLTIQQLPEEDREHILYSIDGLIQHAKTRQAYKK
ncbi:MAG TPA: helix-turn-helix transcriptional regulator [Mucilaginibacter sp.]